MKKVVFGILMLICISTYGQEKAKEKPKYWRELSFGNINGFSLSEQVFTQFTASLSYELKNNYSISSWNGLNYNFNTKQSWVASQTTLDKRINKFVIGAGYQYGSGSIRQFIQPVGFKDNMYFIVNVQYKIKL